MPDIQENIKNDRDLDRRVSALITVAQYNGLKQLAEAEHSGNVSATIRAVILSALRQRYMI